MVDPLEATAATATVVDFADDGTPIFYDEGRREFFVEENIAGGTGSGALQGKRVLLRGDPLLAQVFGKAASGALTVSPNTLANIAEQARQFDATLGRQIADEAARAAEFQQQEERFGAQFGQGIEQQIADREQRAAEANETNRLRVAEVNAGLRARQAELMEDARQAELRNAREEENLRFVIRREEVATQADNRRALREAVALRETITSRIATTELGRQNAMSAVNGLNAQIENNVREFNVMEQARTEALNEQRRQANISDLRQNAQLIGELSADPSDIGRLAGTLRAGGAGALGTLSQQVAAGENNITGESLVPLRGALGAQEALQQGPTLATPNLIEGSFVDLPQFNAPLGEAPEISEIFNAINFDASGIQRPAGPAAMDLSQFFQAIGDPNAIQAQTIQAPTTGAALPAATGGAVTPPGIPIEQQARPQIEESLRAQGQQSDPNFQSQVDPGVSDEALRDFFRASENARRPQPLSPEQEALQAQVRGFAGGGVAPPGNPVVVGDGEGDPRELAMTDFFGNLHVTPFDQLPQAQDGGIFGAGMRDPRQLTGPTVEQVRQQGFEDLATGTSRLTAEGRQLSGPTIEQVRQQALGDFAAGRPGLAGALQPDQVLAPQTVRQTAQNPAVASGAVAPASEAAARMFQQGAFADTLRRGGFTDPTQISPIRVSAPGTSRFLQDVSAAAFGAGGFGPESVFFEELARLTPQGVRPGISRRTA